MKKRVFSGIKPSGNLHLGNYLGAMKQWVSFQDQWDALYCIVDLHAITVPQDPKELHQNSRELAALYIAAGLDPKKSTIFIQSDVPEHSELAWILNCFIPMGWMQRMTQFKDKAGAKKEKVSVGLFDYPALMAADILLYDTNLVPVGDDQKQHVELTRDAAQLVNSRLKDDVLVVPEPFIPKTGARIMGLDDPTKKMAKCDTQPSRTINIMDEPKKISKKIARATTDSLKEIVFDENRPGINNLLTIYQLCSGKDVKEIENNFSGKQYSDLKKELSEVVIDTLNPIREEATKLLEDQKHLQSILDEGAGKASAIAQKTLSRVKKSIGLG